jgi:hypothetical protein
MADERDEYLARPEPKTKEEWQAQVDRWQGKVNIESLLMFGIGKGWLPAGDENHLDDPFWRFMQEPEPTTEDEWRAAMERWSGYWFRESLTVLGGEKGWKMGR